MLMVFSSLMVLALGGDCRGMLGLTGTVLRSIGSYEGSGETTGIGVTGLCFLDPFIWKFTTFSVKLLTAFTGTTPRGGGCIGTECNGCWGEETITGRLAGAG